MKIVLKKKRIFLSLKSIKIQGSSGSVGEGTMTFDRFCGKALNDRVAADQPSSSVAITSKFKQSVKLG